MRVSSSGRAASRGLLLAVLAVVAPTPPVPAMLKFVDREASRQDSAKVCLPPLTPIDQVRFRVADCMQRVRCKGGSHRRLRKSPPFPASEAAKHTHPYTHTHTPVQIRTYDYDV